MTEIKATEDDRLLLEDYEAIMGWALLSLQNELEEVLDMEPDDDVIIADLELTKRVFNMFKSGQLHLELKLDTPSLEDENA